jgi:hypothetical protein
MCLPAFIAAVIERGVRHLASRAAMQRDIARSAATRDAGATLHQLRRLIEKEFVHAMRSELSGESSEKVWSASSQLDICLDDDLAARLDLARLRDAADLLCVAERIEFEALYCGANGSLVVQGDNPLRPEVFARCLAQALDEVAVRRSVRDAWFAHLGEPMGEELASLYRSLSRLLKQAGVHEAQFVPPVVGGRRFESWHAPA